MKGGGSSNKKSKDSKKAVKGKKRKSKKSLIGLKRKMSLGSRALVGRKGLRGGAAKIKTSMITILFKHLIKSGYAILVEGEDDYTFTDILEVEQKGFVKSFKYNCTEEEKTYTGTVKIGVENQNGTQVIKIEINPTGDIDIPENSFYNTNITSNTLDGIMITTINTLIKLLEKFNQDFKNNEYDKYYKLYLDSRSLENEAKKILRVFLVFYLKEFLKMFFRPGLGPRANSNPIFYKFIERILRFIKYYRELKKALETKPIPEEKLIKLIEYFKVKIHMERVGKYYDDSTRKDFIENYRKVLNGDAKGLNLSQNQINNSLFILDYYIENNKYYIKPQ